MKEAVAQRAAMIKALEDIRKYNTNLTKKALKINCYCKPDLMICLKRKIH